MPVDTRHPEYEANIADWKRNRDVVAGERAVKKAGETYLPKPTGLTQAEYDAMRERAAFFPATSRTLDGLTGLIFRKDPQSKLPAVLEKYAADIDMGGQSIDEFAQKLVDDVMMAPHGGILVEFPQVDKPEAARTVADAEAGGLRPYLTFWPAESVISWSTGRVNNKTVITEVRLAETVYEADLKDPWEKVAVEQIRVLSLASGKYEIILFRKDKDGKWAELKRFFPMFRGNSETSIPFVFIGPRDTSPEVQKAPLTDIASVNIAHYRNSADYENGLHWTGSPTPIFIGNFIAPDGQAVAEVKIGSTSGIQMSEGSDAKFLEFQGAGLEPLKQALQDKKDDMAVLGARILAADKKQAEAAETAAIHRAGENSVLASLASSVSKGIETALRYMAKWSGDESSKISYRLNTDYQPTPMTFQELAAMVKAWQDGAISQPELFEALVEGEVIRDDKDFDEHAAELEGEAAERERKMQDTLAAAAANRAGADE